MPSIKTSQSWTITDIQCHFFIQPALSGSKIETATFLASSDPHAKIFFPEEIAEVRKWTIWRPAQVTLTSAIRRPPAAPSNAQSPAAPPCPPSLPACRDFSTWASSRGHRQWTSKIKIIHFVFLKLLRGQVQILSRETIRIHCFKINKRTGDDESISLGL